MSVALTVARNPFQGTPASPGGAKGPFARISFAAAGARSPGGDEGALRAALSAAARELSALSRTAGADAADLLELQLALIGDESLVGPIFDQIAQGSAADLAWSGALNQLIAEYRAASDEYIGARSADLVDLRDRVLCALNRDGRSLGMLPVGAIVAAEDLPPSRFLEIDWSLGGGVALSLGSATSHTAMLARARGIPMVVQLGALPDATIALLDGGRGTIELDPSAARIAAFESRQAAYAKMSVAAPGERGVPRAAYRGETVRLLINVQGLADLAHPAARHADGVGLMRTEFLFEGATGLPDEETQLRAYLAVLDWANGRPVTIRTLDAGGDKPIRGLSESGEANPFLGVRGLRLSLRRPEVFAVQLRALGRAATAGNLKVMFPMVTAPSEFAAARDLFVKAVGELNRARIDAVVPELGIMVEVPAAALTIEAFEASFFSIGSNDLTQYVTACDRTDGSLSHLADPLHPGVLELIRRTVGHGRASGRGVSLCGEMAGEPRCVAALLGCGLRELSMSPSALTRVRSAIQELSAEESLV
jgi:phosphotransferase system enzyme I (PtsI)